jgi:putative DNA methylase
MDYEGNIIRADRLLEDVRKIATDYAVNRILEGGISAEISDLTRYYILFRWNYGTNKLHFDEARKLAQSCNIDLAHEWNRPGFIQKEKEFIKVLGPQDRKPGQIKHHEELIDALHQVLLLWEKSQREEILEVLNETGYGQNDVFYKVAQAISETLPNDNKEKKLLDGFLTGKTRLMEESHKTLTQRRLFD